MTYQICSSEISSWLQCLFRKNTVGERMRWKNWLSQPVWDNGDNIGWWNLVVGIRVHEIKELKWYLGDKSPWDSVINSMCDARTQGWNLDSSWGRGRDKRVGATQWEGNPRKSRFDREEMSIGWASRGWSAWGNPIPMGILATSVDLYDFTSGSLENLPMPCKGSTWRDLGIQIPFICQ